MGYGKGYSHRAQKGNNLIGPGIGIRKKTQENIYAGKGHHNKDSGG